MREHFLEREKCRRAGRCTKHDGHRHAMTSTRIGTWNAECHPPSSRLQARTEGCNYKAYLNPSIRYQGASRPRASRECDTEDARGCTGVVRHGAHRFRSRMGAHLQELCGTRAGILAMLQVWTCDMPDDATHRRLVFLTFSLNELDHVVRPLQAHV